MSEALSMSTVDYKGQYKMTIEYKDVEGKDKTTILILKRDVNYLKKVCSSLLNQFKELGDAQVTSQLEEAIRNTNG